MAKTMDPAFFVAWRKRQGLTQAQFAAKTGDHLVTVKRWETGARKLPPHIGWIMAAIEAGLEPVGHEAMIEVEMPSRGEYIRSVLDKEIPEPTAEELQWFKDNVINPKKKPK